MHVGRKGSADIIKDEFVLAYLVFKKHFPPEITRKMHMDEGFYCAVDGLYYGVLSSLCSTLHLRSVLSGVTLFCLCFSERYNDYDRVYLFLDNSVFICLI